MKQTETGDMFGRDSGQFEVGAGAGRPGQVIRLHPKTGERHMDWLTWGLRPAYTAADPAALRPIHARAETVAELPIFADAFRLRRALVPMTAYFQRRTIGTPAQRYAISRADGHPHIIAALSII